MLDPHVASLDLRSIRFLAKLIETGSVTRAGESCGFAQPQASRVLARLREALGDPLLVRSQHGHVLTTVAESLRPRLQEAEAALARVFASRDFDPATSTRVFRVGASEYAMCTVAADLVRDIRAVAPQAVVQFRPIGPQLLAALEAGEIDMAWVGPPPPGEPFRARRLFRERFVGLVCATHPLARLAAEGGPTIEDWLSFPHISLVMGTPGPNPIDEALAAVGRSRRGAFIALHFSAIGALAGTELVMSVPARLAEVGQRLGLVTFDLPLTLAGFDYSLIWHQRSEGDPALDWLRGLVRSDGVE